MFDFFERYQKQLMYVALAAQKKEVNELTDHEKLAICALAGCKLNFDLPSIERGKIRVQTLHPCGITKIDGKFRVYENVNGFERDKEGG